MVLPQIFAALRDAERGDFRALDAARTVVPDEWQTCFDAMCCLAGYADARRPTAEELNIAAREAGARAAVRATLVYIAKLSLLDFDAAGIGRAMAAYERVLDGAHDADPEWHLVRSWSLIAIGTAGSLDDELDR